VVLPFFDAVIGVVVTLALATGAVLGRALTTPAGAVAAVFGSAIVVLAGFPFLTLIILFVATTTLATRYRFDEKRRRSVQEGTAGERGVSNVLAHILIPTGLAVVAGTVVSDVRLVAVLYASALAFGASDTLASEFGVLSGRARSILTMRPVAPGTNGGVSAAGEMFALAGALVTAVVGFTIFRLFGTPVGPVAIFFVVVTLAGFVGCQIDSVLGEVLENRGWLTKGSTNFVGMLATVAVALGFVGLAGQLA
jgi:uncharacterized protein (TIGR00297 family)